MLRLDHSLFLPSGSSFGVTDPEARDPFASYADFKPTELRRVEIKRLSYYGRDQPPPSPELSREQEAQAFLRYSRRKNARDREALIRQYLCWAFGMASKMKGPRLEFDEAIGVANEGLVEAINKYDPSLGFRFTTYAAFIIRRKLIAAIVNTYPAKISDHVRKTWRALEEDPEQQAKAMVGGEPTTVEGFFERLGENVSLDLSQLHERLPDGDCMPSPGENPADVLGLEDVGEELRAAIQGLPILEREVILARHYREKAESYQSIGRRLRVSKSSAREAYDSAIAKLKTHFRKDT